MSPLLRKMYHVCRYFGGNAGNYWNVWQRYNVECTDVLTRFCHVATNITYITYIIIYTFIFFHVFLVARWQEIL